MQPQTLNEGWVDFNELCISDFISAASHPDELWHHQWMGCGLEEWLRQQMWIKFKLWKDPGQNYQEPQKAQLLCVNTYKENLT